MASNERLRWGKVYTRKNRNNSVSPATTAVETAATDVASPVIGIVQERSNIYENNDVAVPISGTIEVERSNGNEDVDVSQTITQILEAEKAKLAEQRIQLQQDEAVPQIQDLLTGNFATGNVHRGVREGSVGGANGGDGGGGTQEVTGEVVPERSSVGGGDGTQEVNREVVPEVGSGGQPNHEVANGFVKPFISRVDEDRVRISLSGASSRVEIRDLRRTLEGELDYVRSLVKNLEAKELQLTSRNNDSAIVSRSYYPQYTVSDNVMNSRSLMRVNSDVGSVRHIQTQPRPLRPPPRLAVVVNNNAVGEFMEREKRTPKANPYYKNSEFLLGKDRLPSESNKKLKTNGSGKKHFDKHRKQLFRSCTDLLLRLMKHKHGWVFNEPVNANSLGLHDYHDIIKHPMDLGTIKSRLSQNWYKSPKEFAEDVRLVFSNAMTYNPKGQDVHVMAEELSHIFEERWAVIEAKYNAGPTSRKAHHHHHHHHHHPFVHEPMPYHALTHAPQARTLERSDSIKKPPVPKKPKAKDLDKRDMTYEEKQKLSMNLENLPPEKLDAIVQIIKKRSSAVNQINEEIEVDIDSVDTETLWELDRFVTNFKKSLSKYKRKAELALQARARTAQSAPVTSSGPMVADALKESRTVGDMYTGAPSTHVEGGRQADNASSSSSSSSSSSDSGSSSSDSDSDSSSTDGSDAGH